MNNLIGMIFYNPEQVYQIDASLFIKLIHVFENIPLHSDFISYEPQYDVRDVILCKDGFKTNLSKRPINAIDDIMTHCNTVGTIRNLEEPLFKRSILNCLIQNFTRNEAHARVIQQQIDSFSFNALNLSRKECLYRITFTINCPDSKTASLDMFHFFPKNSKMPNILDSLFLEINEYFNKHSSLFTNGGLQFYADIKYIQTVNRKTKKNVKISQRVVLFQRESALLLGIIYLCSYLKYFKSVEYAGELPELAYYSEKYYKLLIHFHGEINKFNIDSYETFSGLEKLKMYLQRNFLL